MHDISTGSRTTIDSRDDSWMAAMARGDFARAWDISDAYLNRRLARGDPAQIGPRHLQSVWNGEPLVGKRVLVRCYHGLGDTIQFIRFAAPLRRLASEVIVWTQPALLGLVGTAVGVDRVLPLHDGAPEVAFDCDIEIMELAHALRVDAQSVACTVPYLFPKPLPFSLPTSMSKLLPKYGTMLRVGLVWRAGDWDQRRSIPGRALSILAHVSGVQLYSLQYGPGSEEAAAIPAHDISSGDAERTAALLPGLDLVISVDTFVAHLAGALGVPVWLLLRSECDWRWMNGRGDCIWYPSMRLFRQQRAGDWNSVIVDAACALQRLAMRESAIEHSEQTIASDVRPA